MGRRQSFGLRQPRRDLRGADAPALPVADAQFARAVSIPIFSSMTDAQVERVGQTVRAVLEGRS